MSVNRYTLKLEPGSNGFAHRVVQEEDGLWVRADEHDAEVERLLRVRQTLEAALSKVGEERDELRNQVQINKRSDGDMATHYADAMRKVADLTAQVGRLKSDATVAFNRRLELAKEMEALRAGVTVIPTEDDPILATLLPLAQEMGRARAKFPSNRQLGSALAEEIGEMADAFLSGDLAHGRQEAIQVACVAMRLAQEGYVEEGQSKAVMGLMADLEAPARRDLGESPLSDALDACRYFKDPLPHPDTLVPGEAEAAHRGTSDKPWDTDTIRAAQIRIKPWQPADRVGTPGDFLIQKLTRETTDKLLGKSPKPTFGDFYRIEPTPANLEGLKTTAFSAVSLNPDDFTVGVRTTRDAYGKVLDFTRIRDGHLVTLPLDYLIFSDNAMGTYFRPAAAHFKALQDLPPE